MTRVVLVSAIPFSAYDPALNHSGVKMRQTALTHIGQPFAPTPARRETFASALVTALVALVTAFAMYVLLVLSVMGS